MNVKEGNTRVVASYSGLKSDSARVAIRNGKEAEVNLDLKPLSNLMGDVVITGTMKEVKRMESPVPVEVYSPAFFKKNPTPNIFDALQNVNGVRPQLNCNICNTGDIHINGLEGPYTMVLIDGMPIVSSLSTVYGLSGIPNSLVERIEIVKGPASSLYGSEAVGGLINIITKNPAKASKLSIDVFGTSWSEWNADLGFKLNAGKKASILTGVNYYNYQNKIDNNGDHFTDVTLQHRISTFQKWSFNRRSDRLANLAARYFYEDRWGGEMNWTKKFRGTDSIYGESIYTSRWEVLGNYQLPVNEKLVYSFSFNDHRQNSRYGNVAFDASQKIFFNQLTLDKKIAGHDLLAGLALRYTFYDDNSIITRSADSPGMNMPQKTWLPGIFIQDEIRINETQQVLLGFRYDRNSAHGNIFTPRIAYKYSPDHRYTFRINAGTGFRVVNLFTEDHAALTGARKIEIRNKLKPEKTYNINANVIKKIFSSSGIVTNLDLTAWYTYFNNRITGNFDADPNKIIYDNLSGHSVSKGLSLNVDMVIPGGLKIMAGMNMQDVANYENDKKVSQLLTERISGNWAISYKFGKSGFSLDYTGNIYGRMRLPLLGSLDPRKPYSPVWSLQNLQGVYKTSKKLEFYAGIKNLLGFTPGKNNPFLIARSHDPFDKEVSYDANGQVQATPGNPYALTFDPNYVYAPNQGRRFFAGIRFNLD